MQYQSLRSCRTWKSIEPIVLLTKKKKVQIVAFIKKMLKKITYRCVCCDYMLKMLRPLNVVCTSGASQGLPSALTHHSDYFAFPLMVSKSLDVEEMELPRCWSSNQDHLIQYYETACPQHDHGLCGWRFLTRVRYLQINAFIRST